MTQNITIRGRKRVSHFQQSCKKQARTDGKNSTNRFDLFLEAKTSQGCARRQQRFGIKKRKGYSDERRKR